MRKQSVEKQVSEELTSYFEQARQVKCPPSMKQNLYAKIGMERTFQWFQPALAFSFVALCTVGLVWHNQHQQTQLEQAERDMQIAMHYMQKVSEKALEDTNTLGIKPGIIVPVSKSVSQMAMAQI
jgi:ABC-type branched-subunit amino acid transport system ATPase component